MPKSKRRAKVISQEARATQGNQQVAEKRKLSYRAYLVQRAIGWSLVGLGVLLGVVHLIEHTGFLRVLPEAADGVYYPLAAVLGVAGAIVLSK